MTICDFHLHWVVGVNLLVDSSFSSERPSWMHFSELLGDWGNAFLPQSSIWKISAYANERKTQHLSSNPHSPPAAKQSCKRQGNVLSIQTIHRWETGQPEAPTAGRTFGIYCTAKHSLCHVHWVPTPVVQSHCSPTAHCSHPLEHTCHLHLQCLLQTSSPHTSSGPHETLLRL